MLLIVWRKCSGMKASKCQEQKDIVTCETDRASCLSESPTLEAGWPFLEIENSPLPSDLHSASQGCDCARNQKEAKLQIPASRSWYQAAHIFNQRNTAKKKGIFGQDKTLLMVYQPVALAAMSFDKRKWWPNLRLSASTAWNSSILLWRDRC